MFKRSPFNTSQLGLNEALYLSNSFVKVTLSITVEHASSFTATFPGPTQKRNRIMTIPIAFSEATNSNASSIRLPADGVPNPNYHPLPGHVGNLTEVQSHALDTLKEELKAKGHFVKERMDDAMLLR
jgi:hypothetical protein